MMTTTTNATTAWDTTTYRHNNNNCLIAELWQRNRQVAGTKRDKWVQEMLEIVRASDSW